MSEPLRPRFAIQRSKIRGLPQDTKEDFTPDKVIYCEIDDEITDIFDRLQKIPSKSIAIVLPKRARVLQSLINLKILKKKISDLEKDVVVVTTDVQGLELTSKAGIPCIEKLVEQKAREDVEMPQKTIRGEKPIRLMRKKISISDVIMPEANGGGIGIFNKIKEKLKKRKQMAFERKFVIVTPNKHALFTLILLTILLLLSVAYIALPGATIYLTPRSSVLDASFNVTFADLNKNRSLLESKSKDQIVVASYQVNPPSFSRSISYGATGKEFKGQNARGVITVTNQSNTPWDLVKQTRFQTKEGVVFRIQNAVRVPPARGGTNGTLDVEVVADSFDINGQAVGALGNIGPSKFFLPGLKNEENREKLSGESKAAMSGGITQIIKNVSKEDIEAAKKQIENQINQWALEDLEKYLAQENLSKKTNLSLLKDKNIIKISVPNITIDEKLVGQNAENFEVKATYSASSIAYDREELSQQLQNRINTRADPDKKIISIDSENIVYKYLEENSQAGKIRLTTTMRAIQIYDLDPEKENGRRFLKKIGDHIAGMKIDEALGYLQRQSDEITNAEIKTWPVWAPTIPNITDNIKFVIREQNDLQ